MLRNEYIITLYQTDCFRLFSKSQENFNKISKRLKIVLPNILPNYLHVLANKIKNWEIAKIQLNNEDIVYREDFHDVCRDKEIIKNYFVMRPRKIIKVFRKTIY